MPLKSPLNATIKRANLQEMQENGFLPRKAGESGAASGARRAACRRREMRAGEAPCPACGAQNSGATLSAGALCAENAAQML